MENLIKSRLAMLHKVAPDSIGDLLRLELESTDESGEEFWLRGKTQGWMRNAAGILHGGMGATLVDQAMGAIAYCMMPGPGTAPAIELNVSYHRPLIPGEDVRLWVRALSVTRTLMRFECRAYQTDRPNRLCISATATYFYKPLERD